MAWNLSGAFPGKKRGQRAQPQRAQPPEKPAASRRPPRRRPPTGEEKRAREMSEVEERKEFPFRFDEGARLSGSRGDEPDEIVDPSELAEAVSDVAEFAPEAVIPMVLPASSRPANKAE